MQKIARNQLCPCGSGRKYKKCCYPNQTKNEKFTTPQTNNVIHDALKTALAYQQAGNLAQAEALYKQILKDHPDNADAWHFLGLIAHQIGKHDIAEQLILKALNLSPSSAIYSNLGLTLQAQGKVEAAIKHFQTALAIQPDYAEGYNNLANAFKSQGKLDAAVECYQYALALKPDYAIVHNNLGVTFKNQGKLDAALLCFQTALLLNKNDPSVYYNQGNVLKLQHKLTAAMESYRQALALKPDYTMAQTTLLYIQQHCHEWTHYADNVAKTIQNVNANTVGCTPLSFLSLSDSASAQLKCASAYAATQHPPAATPLCANQRYQHHKIRLAYVSADFRGHAVSILMAGIFEQHNRQRFEIIAISLLKPEDSPLGRRVKATFDRFIDVSDKTDYEVACLMRELEIDIAIDLMGFTKGSRTSIFAYRPAPIQVNYLGFPATMGAVYMDYILADSFLIPEPLQAYYAEKIVYLPDCFQANDNNRVASARIPTRLEAGLPESAFVFCSFNISHKITPIFFDSWMRLLSKVPNSVLWLVDEDLTAQQNLRNRAASFGIDSSRLIFADRLPYPEHLARFALADLFLDTLPFNAGTTASDALWVGVPVVTCVGEAFAARMAGSLLNAMGLPELITYTLEDYEALAVKLATHVQILTEVRNTLAKNRLSYPLFNTARFCHHLELAYLTMWEKYQRGQPSVSFTINET
jgi:predicted O-linked N-acetylglucosamine transferase (SPINDLY family)